MPKKGENIYKRKDGRWEGRYIRTRDFSGKLVYGSIYGKTYTEVKQKLTQRKAATPHIEEPSHLFRDANASEWLNYWLNVIVKPRIKRSTYANYRSKMENHILPILGPKKLTALKVNDIELFVNELIERKLSATTIKDTIKIVKIALNKACQENYLLVNPCKDVTIPKSARKEIFVLSMEERKRLEERALREKECSPIILALYTGMRIGEISGLKWSDIDFEQDLIQVNRTLQRVASYETPEEKTKVIIDKPKTSLSCRQIPLSANLKEYLLKHQELAVSEFVIHSKGSFAEPRLISYRFKKIAKEIQLEHLHFHVLRHTFATMCVEGGADIASLSKLLGHASTKMTLDIYTSSLWEKRQKTIALIDDEFQRTMKVPVASI